MQTIVNSLLPELIHIDKGGSVNEFSFSFEADYIFLISHSHEGAVISKEAM